MDVRGPADEMRPVLLLARPGHDARRTQALVYGITACPLCGGAFFSLLRRDGEQWTVVRRSAEWHS